MIPSLSDRNKSIKWTVQFPIDLTVDDWHKTDEAKDAITHLILDGIKRYQAEGFKEVEEIKDFTVEINDEEDKFIGVMEEHFTLSVETEKQENWIAATDVYKFFKQTQMTQYQIKERFDQLEVKCVKTRKSAYDIKDDKGRVIKTIPADINPRSYFKGLVRKPRDSTDDY